MNSNPYIYFIKPVGMTGPIKIGCSCMPERRLSTLSTWSPFELEIVTTIAGGQRLERNIHECFADLHTHREWFMPGRHLLDAISRLKNGEPIEQVINLNKRIGRITNGRCGGAGWSEVTRQKMSIFHRVRGAMKKIGGSPYNPPKQIDAIMRISEQRILNPDELAQINRFTSNPFAFAPTSDQRGAA
jgi:hypothetical protein